MWRYYPCSRSFSSVKTPTNCVVPTVERMSIMVIMLNVCLPFIIMFACHGYTVCFAIRFSRAKYGAKATGTMINAVRRNTSERISEENRQAILVQREREITCTMTMVLGAFILCWAPSSFYYFLDMFCHECYQPSFKRLEPVFNASMKLLTFVNSCKSVYLLLVEQTFERNNFLYVAFTKVRGNDTAI